MHQVLGVIARVVAVTTAVVGIRYLLRVKPTNSPAECTVEQVVIMTTVASTYGFKNVSEYTGYSVEELLLLCTLVSGGVNYVWHHQRVHKYEFKESVERDLSPHDSSRPQEAQAD